METKNGFPRPIPSSGGYLVLDFGFKLYTGRIFEGSAIVNNPSNRKETFDWKATYQGEERWKIDGAGAPTRGGGRVANTTDYPFSMDPPVNINFPKALIQWLNENRKILADPVMTLAEKKALTNGHSVESAPPTVTKPEQPKAVVPQVVKTESVPIPTQAKSKPIATPKPKLSPVPPVAQPPAVLDGVSLEGQSSFEGAIKAFIDEIIVFQPDPNNPKFSGQPRKYFDHQLLVELAESLKGGQEQVITVRPVEGIQGKKWELIDGERRYRAAQVGGIKFLWAVVKRVPSKRRQHLSSLIQNLFKADHTNFELSCAFQEQVDAGETIVSLAKLTAKTRQEIYNLLSLQKLHPDLKVLLDPPTPKADRMSIAEGSAMAKVRLDKQLEVWNGSKDQPTRGLVVRKIHELGKPYFIALRKGGEQKNSPCDIARSVERRINNLAAAILELKSLNAEEWQKYAVFRGHHNVSSDMSRLTEIGSGIADIKGRMSRARVNAKNIAA